MAKPGQSRQSSGHVAPVQVLKLCAGTPDLDEVRHVATIARPIPGVHATPCRIPGAACLCHHRCMTCPIYAQFLGKFLDVFILGAQDGLTFISPTFVPVGRPWIWESWDDAADDPALVEQGIRESRPGDWTDALQDAVGAVLEAGAQRLAKHPDAAAQALLDRARAMLGHTASDDIPHHRYEDDWWPLADGDSPDDISHMPHSGPCVVVARPEPTAGRDDLPHGQAGAKQAE